MPERPFSPNRTMINLGGIVAGLAIGLVLVGLLEYRDVTMKTDDEVSGVLGLPVLAVVPSHAVRQRAQEDALPQNRRRSRAWDPL